MLAEQIFRTEFEKNTVFQDRNLVMPSYTPEDLPFREKQVEEVSRILAHALKGKRPENLFIYGKVGTGKTSVTKHVMKKFNEFAVTNNVMAECCYVNCRTHNSGYKVLNKIVKDFYPEENFIGFSATFIYEKLLSHAKKGRHIILTLDEIDTPIALMRSAGRGTFPAVDASEQIGVRTLKTLHQLVRHARFPRD